MIRVVIVDDQALVRSGFALILGTDPGIEVVAEAADGVQAVTAARALRPDVVLMDIRMPVMDGIEATRHITADPQADGVRVLVLTTFDADEYVVEALRAGASGFLLKDTSPDELIRAVGVVAGGDALLSPAVTRRMIAQFVRATAPTPDAGGGTGPGDGSAGSGGGHGSGGGGGWPDGGTRGAAPEAFALPPLTQREEEVLRAVAGGLSNLEIAGQLVVSYSTVKTHVSHLLTKLDARDRAQLVMLAYRAGLVE